MVSINGRKDSQVEVIKGDGIEFVCSATGVGADDFIYQWFLNDLPVADKSILVISAVSEENSGDYKCFVRNQYNGIGQSEVARLVIGTYVCKSLLTLLKEKKIQPIRSRIL